MHGSNEIRYRVPFYAKRSRHHCATKMVHRSQYGFWAIPTGWTGRRQRPLLSYQLWPCIGKPNFLEFKLRSNEIHDIAVSWVARAEMNPPLDVARDRAVLARLMGPKAFLTWLQALLGDVREEAGSAPWPDTTSGIRYGLGTSRNGGTSVVSSAPTLESVLKAWIRNPATVRRVDRTLDTWVSEIRNAFSENPGQDDREALQELNRFEAQWRVIREGLELRRHCGMSTPKAFQKATISCALKAFDGRRRVRRFLVADEVGLGKTIVARGVIQSMMRRKRSGEPLRIFYVCSSLAIAAQNKASLLKVIPDPKMRDRTACDVDRLTLAPNRLLPNDVPMHLYTLTPDTSVPDRKGKHRAGTAPERALLHNLLASRYPSLTQIGDQGEEWLRCNALRSWEDCKNWSRCTPSSSLCRAFFPVLRQQCGVGPTESLALAIRRKLNEDRLETIKLLRVTLAKTGLYELAPDLVIFDEFQRFQDLLARNDRGSDIAREMVRIGRGGPCLAVAIRNTVPALWRESRSLLRCNPTPPAIL